MFANKAYKPSETVALFSVRVHNVEDAYANYISAKLETVM